MPEFLEAKSDKFTFRVATDRLYSAEGLWVKPEAPGRVRVGLGDFLQQRSGDLAFLSVKPKGTKLVAGDDLADMETVKVTQALPSPVAGAVLEANPALVLTPEVANQDPYGSGWLAVLEVANWDAERPRLLDPRAYFTVMQKQVEQEVQAS
jgi:glycine cleavage system H protein